MINFYRTKKLQIPLRIRLTLWYLLLLGVTLSLFGMYQYYQFKHTLLASIDASLAITETQALANVDTDNARLAFQNTENWSVASRIMIQSDFAIRIVSPSGQLWDQIGDTQFSSSAPPETPGIFTIEITPDQVWRVYNQPITNIDGQVAGWLQIVQSLDVVYETLDNMRIQLAEGLLLMLVLAGVGGVYLTNKALFPLNTMVRTANSISAGDLSQRIDYQGPDDEIGRLARTFDQMLARLQAAFERERRFTSDAAHELRTPLTAIKGQIEVTLNRSRTPKEYHTTLQRVHSQVERLIRLSNALLFLSKSDRQGISWNPTPLQLDELLGTLAEQIRPTAEEKHLQIILEVPKDISVYGDPDQLIRLFLNLLDNAVKYTPLEGEIKIFALQEVDRVKIAIHNTGPGISSEHLPKIFDRFYRVDADRASATGGSGLGLAIVREIVRWHHGSIQMASQPDEGVTVTVYLPSQGAA